VSLEEHIDAEKEFPLLVSYPAAGHFRLLIWNAEYEGNNIIAALSEPGALTCFARVLKKHGGDAKPVGYWDATIVCPPQQVRRAAALSALSHDYNDFASQVGFRMKMALEKNQKVTLPGVKRCTKNAKDDHWDCPACLHGFVVEGYTRESFYLAKRTDPNRVMPSFPAARVRTTPKPTRFTSRAPEGDPKQPFFAVTEDFGHHCKGLVVQPVDFKDEYLGKFGTNTMFFFQGSELKVPETALTMFRDFTRKHEDKEKQRKQTFDKERAENDRRNLDSLTKLVLS
jgi:hypothetical protein